MDCAQILGDKIRLKISYESSAGLQDLLSVDVCVYHPTNSYGHNMEMGTKLEVSSDRLASDHIHDLWFTRPVVNAWVNSEFQTS